MLLWACFQENRVGGAKIRSGRGHVDLEYEFRAMWDTIARLVGGVREGNGWGQYRIYTI